MSCSDVGDVCELWQHVGVSTDKGFGLDDPKGGSIPIQIIL